jgi:hypothetical protein
MNKYIFSPFVFLMFITGISANPLPKHWHESKGFGTTIKGGIAGEVYKVTNLKSSGAGSLKDAVSKGNRLVVFEVGGVIVINGRLIIGSNTTIAGQTAPSPGISLIKGNMTASGSNIVVSHITTVLGDYLKKSADAANIAGNNIVFDHVTALWAIDEVLSMGRPINVTLYKCIIAEGLRRAGHGDGEHSKGSLINKVPKNLSLIGCLYAHNALRGPRVDEGEVLIANQVNYNWATGWDEPKPHWFNHVVHIYQAKCSFVGNVALQGPESVGKIYLNGHVNSKSNAYIKDNIIKDRDGKDLQVHNPNLISVLETPEVWPSGFKQIPAHESLYEVLRTVGSRPGDRDTHNSRIVRSVANGTGKLIDSQKEVGGYPNYPETKRSLTVPDGPEARQAWLDSLENEIAIDKKIDLSRLYTVVGSKSSDKLQSAVPICRKVKLQSDDSVIEIFQGNFRNRQLHASFNLSKGTPVSLKIFDLSGNTVALQHKHCQAGLNKMNVNVEHLPIGIYICHFTIGNKVINHIFNCF